MYGAGVICSNLANWSFVIFMLCVISWHVGTQYIKSLFIGSDNGLAPTKRQAIIWTNDDYCIGPMAYGVSIMSIK